MTDDTMDTPTPEFRAQLEWEITRAVRREARLGADRGIVRRNRLRMAGLIAACLMVGAITGLASAQAGEGVRRDSLLEAMRAEMSLVSMRLNLAQLRYDDAARKAKAGVFTSSELGAAQVELESMQAKVARVQLNIAEIQASSRAARDELNAPLVRGRDFVKERIELELRDAQRELNAAERELSVIDNQVRMGVATQLSSREAQVALAHARASLVELSEKYTLRREFVEKGTPVEQLAKRLDVTRIREELRVAEQQLGLAKDRLQQLERQRASGAASELEMMRGQVEVKERELELQRLLLQMKRVGGE